MKIKMTRNKTKTHNQIESPKKLISLKSRDKMKDMYVSFVIKNKCCCFEGPFLVFSKFSSRNRFYEQKIKIDFNLKYNLNN